MKFDENIWDSVDAEELEAYRQRNFGKYKGMLVYVTRKTRSRFGPKIEAAQKGEFGIVIGEWVSTMGTQKIIFVDHMLRERGTTLKMVKFWGHREQEHAKPWADTLTNWMDETYVPVLVTRKKKDLVWEPLELVTVTVELKSPTAIGVPEITPVVELILKFLVPRTDPAE